MNYTTYMYIIVMKEVILMIYIILTIIAVLLCTYVWSSQFRTVSFSSINTDSSNPRSPSKRK